MTNERAIELLRALRGYQANRAQMLLPQVRREALDNVAALEHAITMLGMLELLELKAKVQA